MRRHKWLLLGLFLVWGIWSWAWFIPPHSKVGPLSTIDLLPPGPLLVFAPHSDDEALAAAGLIQQAEREGATPRVVLVTGGEAFTWSARAHYRRWQLNPADMLAYGEYRVLESLSALNVMGLPPERFSFLGYPDRRVNYLWTTCWRAKEPCTGPFTQVDTVLYPEARTTGAAFAGEVLLQELVEILQEVRPGLVVYPHPNDSHVDHWGLSAFVTAALEQVRRTDSTWQVPVEWVYLVHRGEWPTPKGYLPDEALLPPQKLARESMTTWFQFPLTEEQVAVKFQAIEQYKTQTQILRRYMHSFARTNELFGTMERIQLPLTPPWDLIQPDIEQPGTVEDGVPPWTGLPWQLVISDPHADTVAREVQRGADLLRVWAANDGERLYLAIRTSAPTRSPVSLRVGGRGFTAANGWGDLFELALLPGKRHIVRHWPDGALVGGITLAHEANWDRIDLPLEPLGSPEAIMLNVESRVENLLIDRTAWRFVSLDGR